MLITERPPLVRLFTSESVTPGHPDKLCDQISDAILDAYLEVDPGARVAVEVMATADALTIGGEVGSWAFVDRASIARTVVADIGYDGALAYPSRISDQVVEQSPEIAAGVFTSLEARSGIVDEGDVLGAGDQGLMFGYATDETPELMPVSAVLAHDLARQLFEISGQVRALRPDGKTQVTVGLDEAGAFLGVDTVLVSAQHEPDLDPAALETVIEALVIEPVMERRGLEMPDRVLVNPSGSFVLGGPAADTGLTGRKIIVDTYGGAARHGGGAFSGKDPSKVDRSGAYMARWVAKHVVSAGLAASCEVQVAYAIGSAQPVSVFLETFGTEAVPREAIEDAVLRSFDLRPSAVIERLGLRRPIYRPTATFGHFGRPGFPWELVDEVLVSRLRSSVGLRRVAA